MGGPGSSFVANNANWGCGSWQGLGKLTFNLCLGVGTV